jgi:PleD family two-component response regulator
MSDFSFFDPPIEIAAGSPRFEMIEMKLKASGLRPFQASSAVDFTASDPLLIDTASAAPDLLEAVRRAPSSARQIILLDISATPPSPAGDALLLRRDSDLAALKSRLTALARRAARMREAEIRRETMQLLGTVPPAAETAAPSLLYIGEGSPLFLALQSPLKKRGIDVTAALSRDTARLYMAERRFAAALLDLESFRGDGTATARWITEEHGLSALPIITLANPAQHINVRQNSVISVSTEFVDAAGPTAGIAAQIETVCRRLAACAPVMPGPALSATLSDAATGLFNRRFLEAHISRQMRVSGQRAEPISVLTFRFDVPLAQSRSAQQAFAAILRAELRDLDCPAHYQPGVFAISLPAIPYRGGVQLAERIARLAIEQAGLAGHAIGWRVIEKRAYHSAQSLLGAGLIGPLMRPRLAA